MNVDLTSDPPGDTAGDSGDQPLPPVETGQRLPRRSRHDRYLGGVAGGIAERFAIDPFIIRAALLGSTLFAAYAADWVPIVPAAYTLLWLTLPGPTGRAAIRTVRSGSGRRETVAALASFVVIAVMLTRPVFGFALALAALAWVLLSDEPLTVTTSSTAAADSTETNRLAIGTSPSAVDPASTDFDATAPAIDERTSWGRRRRFERGETLVANFARPARPARREPALWPLTLSLLAIIAVGGFMADALMGDGINPAIMVNLALLAVGGVIALSAWRGRAMGTAVLAMALLPVWIGFSVADIGRFDGGGPTTHIPTALPASGVLEYENGYGSMTIDLRQLPLAEGDEVSLDIKATAGSVTVLAPPSTETTLRSNIGLGTTTVRGNGVGFYEYDREPHMDRSMIRRYEARGSGCIQEYWATWSLLVDNHTRAGVDLSTFAADDPDDVEPILAAILAAGFITPQLIDESGNYGPDQTVLYTVIDEFGNEFYLSGNELLPGADGFEQEAGGYTVIDEFGNEFYLSGDQALTIEQQLGRTSGRSYQVIDEFGNEFYLSGDEALSLEQQLDQPAQPIEPVAIQQSNTATRTWSYSADIDGLPCVETPPPDDPASIEINATIGIGTLEVRRDEF